MNWMSRYRPPTNVMMLLPRPRAASIAKAIMRMINGALVILQQKHKFIVKVVGGTITDLVISDCIERAILLGPFI